LNLRTFSNCRCRFPVDRFGFTREGSFMGKLTPTCLLIGVYLLTGVCHLELVVGRRVRRDTI
jgi:hypothetical protein